MRKFWRRLLGPLARRIVDYVTFPDAKPRRKGKRVIRYATIRRDIMGVLLEHKYLDSFEIGSRLGIPYHNIGSAMARMWKDGDVERIKGLVILPQDPQFKYRRKNLFKYRLKQKEGTTNAE